MNTQPTATHCPWCGRRHDFHSSTDNPLKRPKPGNLSICWGCHQLAVYTEDLGLRRPTPDEATEAAQNPAVQQALAALQTHHTPLQALAFTRQQARHG